MKMDLNVGIYQKKVSEIADKQLKHGSMVVTQIQIEISRYPNFFFPDTISARYHMKNIPLDLLSKNQQTKQKFIEKSGATMKLLTLLFTKFVFGEEQLTLTEMPAKL